MNNATILKDGKVVRIGLIQPINYFNEGHLKSFSINDKIYSYFDKINGQPAGYFETNKYLEFRSNAFYNAFAFNSNVEFKDWELAEYGDVIIINKVIVNYVSPHLIGDNYICSNDYTTYYSNNQYFNSIDIDISNFEILGTNCSNGASNFNLNSIEFFTNNIIQAILDDLEFINIIRDITLLINIIDDKIYESFNSPHIDNQLIPSPTSFLDPLNFLDYDSKKKMYKEYRNSLSNYFNIVSNYFKLIEDGDDMLKTAVIVASLHPIMLREIDVLLKIKIIKFIADEYYIKDEFKDYIVGIPNSILIDNKLVLLSNKTFQDLIVNLTYSFTVSDSISDSNDGFNSNIDKFLEFFLEIRNDGVLFENKVTYYELVYRNLNQPFNITEGLISLSNAIFNTNYTPNNSKSAFVNGLYMLWQFSKYNPYHYETLELKPLKVGFKILDATQASFSNPMDAENINCLYQYTHEVGYESFIKTETTSNGISKDFTLYKEKHKNASPIVLPYESKRILGFFSDNYKFNFLENKITAHELKPISTSLVNYFDGGNFQKYEENYNYIFYGIYDLYQPVSVVNTNIDTKAPFITTTTSESELGGNTINSLIPIFVLKHIDDAGDQSDVENMIGFLIDGLLTFSGFGNFTKLRHLRWAVHGTVVGESIALFSKQGFRVLLGGVEFSAGVVGFFANFVECIEPTVPQNSSDPAHIEAWENYRFCQNMKTFISIFQLATLTVTVGDSIVSIAMKKQAARVIDSAGGGIDHNTVKNTVKNKLDEFPQNNTNGVASTDEVAEVITNAGIEKYLNAAADLLIEVNKKYDKIQPNILQRIRNNADNFSESFFNTNFNATNLKIIIQECLEFGISDQKIISDIVLASCRRNLLKQLTFNETRIVINYYVKVIRKRGFPTGFHNLADYKLFSQKVKTFLDDYCNTWGIKNAKYEIQGSVQFKSSPLDPNVNDVPVLTKNGSIVAPDDLDGRIVISQHQANKFLNEMKGYWRSHYKSLYPNKKASHITDLVNLKMNPIIKKANKDGIIHKHNMPPSTYKDDLLNAVKRDDGTHIFYLKNSETPPKTEIGFAIVIQRSNFDIQPAMSLKF